MSGQQIDGMPTVGPERRVRDAGRHVRGIRGDGLEAVDAGEHRDERQRIPAAQRLRAPRMRVVGDAVAASDHRRIGHLVGEADARRKELLAVADAVVLRDAAPARRSSASLVVGSYDSMPRPPERLRFGYSSHRSPRSTVSFGVARQRSRM